MRDEIGEREPLSHPSSLVPHPLQAEIERLGPWFHNLHLPDGTQTNPTHPFGDFPAFKWWEVAKSLPEDLSGWTALDIGCNAGFYSFEMARRGARVTGIDLDPHYLAQADWAARQTGLQGRVEFRRMQVYDLAHIDQTFDLVLFMGVFYHLRYPMLGLDIVAQKTRRLLLFQTLTMPGAEVFEKTWEDPAADDPHLRINSREVLHERGWPKMAFIEHRFSGDPTNWWLVNHAGAEAMLRSAGMRIIGHPGHEMYLCEPDPEHPSCISTWNAAEILSATGRPWQEPSPPHPSETDRSA